ncbi:hypothetical protein BZA05DRAFT_214375 [Tricharina praecox]|uniref:uncharacterized protein n=1 Tax=Tricharina praecox TaxID=43433 RepID=UPI0022201490|nr:uncharacterized protein BZA05DRAFT_214375 [Tricharina praecox]KAI5855656.1 hypothetical protein BZA05DRAFT_214375 [Tricharina praecox]
MNILRMGVSLLLLDSFHSPLLFAVLLFPFFFTSFSFSTCLCRVMIWQWPPPNQFPFPLHSLSPLLLDEGICNRIADVDDDADAYDTVDFPCAR